MKEIHIKDFLKNHGHEILFYAITISYTVIFMLKNHGIVYYCFALFVLSFYGFALHSDNEIALGRLINTLRTLAVLVLAITFGHFTIWLIRLIFHAGNLKTFSFFIQHLSGTVDSYTYKILFVSCYFLMNEAIVYVWQGNFLHLKIIKK